MDIKQSIVNFMKWLWNLLAEIFKGMSWFILTCVIGLCTTWVDWFVRSYKGSYEFPFNEFISSGALLIVCITIVSSLVIDYIFINHKSSVWIKFFFSVFPAIWLLLAGVAYAIFLIDHNDGQIKFIAQFQLFFLLITAVYAIFIKLYIWRYGQYVCSLDN